MSTDPRIAICPGSYDPVTNGHLDVINRAARMFERVIVAVMSLPPRKGETLFTVKDRAKFLRDAITATNVEVKPFASLVVDFAREQGAGSIVKGLRAISDFEYEFEMNQLNRLQAPDVESVYLMASPQYSFISSSGIKELALFGGTIDGLVPEQVAQRLKEALTR